jgi:hypothetical protein
MRHQYRVVELDDLLPAKQRLSNLGCLHLPTRAQRQPDLYEGLLDTIATLAPALLTNAHELCFAMQLVSYDVVQGPIVQELRQVFNESSATVVFRVFSGLSFQMGSNFDVEVHTGTIDVDEASLVGKEVSVQGHTLVLCDAPMLGILMRATVGESVGAAIRFVVAEWLDILH